MGNVEQAVVKGKKIVRCDLVHLEAAVMDFLKHGTIRPRELSKESITWMGQTPRTL